MPDVGREGIGGQRAARQRPHLSMRWVDQRPATAGAAREVLADTRSLARSAVGGGLMAGVPPAGGNWRKGYPRIALLDFGTDYPGADVAV